MPCYICSDATIERVAELLEDNPRGILMGRDELSAWIGSLTRYKGGAGTDVPNWLELYSGGDLFVTRKTGESREIFVRNAAVCIAGGIQPGTLARAFTPENLESGLMARFLLAWPPRRPGRWTEAEINPQTVAAYNRLLDQLRGLEPARDDRGDSHPGRVKFTPEAKSAWIRFYNQWDSRKTSAEGELAAVFSKLEGAAARLALIHALVQDVSRGGNGTGPVGMDSVEAGTTLATWFAEEAERVYGLLQDSGEDRATRKLLEFILAQPGAEVSVRNLRRLRSGWFENREAALQALDKLAPHYGGWKGSSSSGTKAGRPSDIFALDPQLTFAKIAKIIDHPLEDDEEDPGEGIAKTPDALPKPPDPISEPPEKHEEFSFLDNFGNFGNCQSDALPPTGAGGWPGEGPEGFGNPQRVLANHPESLPTSEEALDLAPPGGEELDKMTIKSYHLVTTQEGIQEMIQALGELDRSGPGADESGLPKLPKPVYLDTETTGLNPRTDRARLLTLGVGEKVFIVDLFQVDPSVLWPYLRNRTLVGHNLLFDLGFLAQLGYSHQGELRDTMLMAQLLRAGSGKDSKLATLCQEYLGVSLDKTEQRSNWAGELTEEQLAYAARDVAVLPRLLEKLKTALAEAGLVRVAEIENRALPALVAMARNGVPVDRDDWLALARHNQAKTLELEQELNKLAPAKPGEKLLFEGGRTWNWNSPAQVKEAMALAGVVLEETSDETLAGLDHPLARALREFRKYSKLGSSFGESWLEKHGINGRIFPNWHQLGAASGRMSCSNPNMQQIPRGREYRECFRPGAGMVLVKCDFSQVELRLAARIANDKTMIQAFIDGKDLHTETAREVLGKQEVSKGDRQLAKALNFGLLYGMGKNSLKCYSETSYGVSLTITEAQELRKKFFGLYKGLAQWHAKHGPNGTIATRTLLGRRRLAVNRYTEKLNSPVQGSGADAIKLALGALWERREEFPEARLVAVVHDEILLECPADQGAQVGEWLKEIMETALAPMLDPVPARAEGTVGETWGG